MAWQADRGDVGQIQTETPVLLQTSTRLHRSDADAKTPSFLLPQPECVRLCVWVGVCLSMHVIANDLSSLY